jgi:hypothetical protein
VQLECLLLLLLAAASVVLLSVLDCVAAWLCLLLCPPHEGCQQQFLGL